jgi:hypothetical protein
VAAIPVGRDWPAVAAARNGSYLLHGINFFRELRMLLYAIFPLDEGAVFQAMSIKVEGEISAVIAFRSEASANLFIQERLGNGKFSVLVLTLEEFDKARANAQSHLGVDTYLKICD